MIEFAVHIRYHILLKVMDTMLATSSQLFVLALPGTWLPSIIWHLRCDILPLQISLCSF